LVWDDDSHTPPERTSRHTIKSSYFLKTVAYCLSARGAQTLLSKLPANDCLDHFIARQFSFLNYRAAFPPLLIHSSYGGADIRHSILVHDDEVQHEDVAETHSLVSNGHREVDVNASHFFNGSFLLFPFAQPSTNVSTPAVSANDYTKGQFVVTDGFSKFVARVNNSRSVLPFVGQACSVSGDDLEDLFHSVGIAF
jgi:hypothetical protein